MSSSYSSLSSIRMPLQSQAGESGTEAWKRDREAASKYFDRARSLQPDLDIPALPQEGSGRPAGVELEMPSLDLAVSTPESVASGESMHTDTEPPLVRRRKKVEEQLAADVVKKGREREVQGKVPRRNDEPNNEGQIVKGKDRIKEKKTEKSGATRSEYRD